MQVHQIPVFVTDCRGHELQFPLTHLAKCSNFCFTAQVPQMSSYGVPSALGAARMMTLNAAAAAGNAVLLVSNLDEQVSGQCMARNHS